MPLFGQLNLQSVLARLPEMQDFETEPWELPGAAILQLSFEVGQERADASLPKAMHPSVPRYVTWVISYFPQTPVGPFHLAQLRLMGRAGVHPRGYVLQAYTDAPAATQALRQRWGFPADTAEEVALRTHYDRVFATVVKDGQKILDVALSQSETVSGADIQYISSVHLVQVTGIDPPGPRLVQVDPRYTLHRAERGRPVLHYLDEAAWQCAGFAVVHTIVGSVTTVDTDLPRLRFVMDPELPVVQGTTRLH
jgi:Acetoacetate decarboxylase (ADC)